MRKLSKILAVVLTVVLLCGMIATMISADDTSAEIIFPEYTAPSAASVIAKYSSNFEEGSADPGQFGPSNGFILNKITAGGNTYAQFTNINADGTLATHKARSMGNMFSPYMVMGNYDYITVDFDIIADKYTNGTDIKTIEEYNALDDKTGYYPTYATTRFTLEAMGVVGYGDAAFLWIKQDATTKDWFLCTSNGASRYYLPTEAGVWTHVTYAIKYDVNVTYTDSNGTVTVPYREYDKLVDKNVLADVSIMVNSTLDIYANGEFAFNIPSATKTNAVYTADSFKAGGNTFKYNQLQYGTSGSSVATTPISFGLDNITLAGYVDGYEGDLADAINNNTSLIDTEDAIFNQNYNKVSQIGATVTKADGTVYGYMTAGQAMNAIDNGDVVEFVSGNGASLALGVNDEAIETITVKTNGRAFDTSKIDTNVYTVTEADGIYTIQRVRYVAPTYVGPVGATAVSTYFGTYAGGSNAVGGFVGTSINGAYHLTNWVDGAMVTSTAKQYGTLASLYKTLFDAEYATFSFDVMADKYTSGTDLITVAEYDALSDEQKALYTPSFTDTRFYLEMPAFYTGGNGNLLYIKQINGKWYLSSGNGTTDVYPLPERAGVWTNVTYAYKFDVNIKYTVDGVANTASYSEYQAMDKTGHTDVSAVFNTECHIFANGEYAFKLNWGVTGGTSAYPFSGDNGKFKYVQLQSSAKHNDSSSRVTNPTSINFANVALYKYADGYNGELADDIANKTSIVDNTDTVYNSAYNKTYPDYMLGVVNAGKTSGYKFNSVKTASDYIKDGSTVELFADLDNPIDISGFNKITVITNGFFFEYVDDGKINYEITVEDGVYVIEREKFSVPEYAGPVGPTRYGNYYDYDSEGSKKFHSDSTASNKDTWSDKGLLTGSGEKVMYGNTYAGYALVDYAGSTVTDMVRLGGWYNTPILKYDYVTIDLDIVADMYRNTTSGALISIEEYNALSDSAKAEYEASYHELQFYNEFSFSYNYAHMLQIRKVDGKYAIVDNGNTFWYFLPEKAGVWTHITWVASLGNTVTYYTDDSKTTTATMPYAEYVASGKGETYYVSTNLKDTTLSVYVNGEYQGDLAGFNDGLSNNTSYANLAKVYYKYLFAKGAAQSGTSTFKQNFSMGFDNNFLYVYNEGHNGALVNAKETGLQNATDTVYNAGYNMTSSPILASVLNAGETYGYKFYNVDAIMNYVKDGATLELFGDLTIDMAGMSRLTVKTNGNSFKFINTDPDALYESSEVDGVVSIYPAKYAVPEYVGPVGTSTLWNFTDFTANDFKSFYANNGIVHSTVKTDNNVYGNITNWVDGKMVEHTAQTYGNLGNVYATLGAGDYFVWSFDIMADKYTDGETLITIAEYEALSAAEKANFKPSYHETSYMIEIPGVNGYKNLWIKNFDGKWYFTAHDGKNTSGMFALPEVAGVWTNVSIIFKTDINVTYSAGTVSYGTYLAAGQPEKDTATLSLKVDAAVYANGEFAFENGWATDTTMPFTSYSNNFKYTQMRAGQWTSSRLSAPMSICYDNVSGHRYPEGYQGDLVTAFAERAPLHNVLDSIYNKTYNKTGVYASAVYNGVDTGSAYFANESAFANVKEGDTIELFKDSAVTYSPLVSLTYIKTNGYDFKYELPDGYTYYETDVDGIYVLKEATAEDYVDVEWYVGDVLYAVTSALKGTEAVPVPYSAKVHPWVTEYATAWAKVGGGDLTVGNSGNKFVVTETAYEASAEILMNITTTQAITTNTYVPALTEAEMALISDISYMYGTTNRWGTAAMTLVNIGGESYYKCSETNRIIYNERDRVYSLNFTYDGVELSITVNANAITYFDAVLGSNLYSDAEKELVYAALYYADAVARYNTFSTTNGFVELVNKYAEYKTEKSTLEEIMATAVKENNTDGLVTMYNLSVYDGYAAFFNFTLDMTKLPEGFDRKTVTITYQSVLNGSDLTSSTRRDITADGQLTFQYDMAIYNVRQTLTLNINGTESTFNLASYIKALYDAGYALDSAEMTIALALYNYSECSEIYKKA